MIQPTNVQQLYPQMFGQPNMMANNPCAMAPSAPYDYSNSLYQMPMASAYQQVAQPQAYQQYAMQPQMPQQGGANAVSINIYNPQAYASAPQAPAFNPMLAQGMAQFQQQTMPIIQQPMMQAPMMQPMMQQPMMQAPMMAAPAPQIMPDSVMSQTNEVQQPQASIAEVATPQAYNQVQVEEPKQSNVPVVDTQALIQGLASQDTDVKAKAINDIASLAQDTPEIAYQVVAEPVMNALINVINEDTTNLEGPSAQQIAAVEKMSKGEQLTPEETALTEQLSPRDKANKNRIFSLYTLAMIQKLQRDELNQYIDAQRANGETPIEPIALEQLAGFNEIANIINNDSRPEVRIAAIQALQHVAEPQEKQTVETILSGSLNSNDEDIKAAAQEAMQKFAA